MSAKARRNKRLPQDANQLAKRVVDIATSGGYSSDPEPGSHVKDPAAVSLGRRGGLKGGRARADKLTPDERRRIAQRAAQARWSKDDS